MSVPGAPRSKNFAPGGSGLPTDFNSMQDTYGLGATSIAGPETLVAPVAYTTMTTPDQVTGVVLPANGLIAVAFQATWQESVAGAALAAIFVGANQLKGVNSSSASPFVLETPVSNSGAANVDKPLQSGPGGLVQPVVSSTTAYTGDVTTGQVVGLANNGTAVNAGPCYIFATAGTYTVSIKYKASSGNVTAKNRKLWVWTLGS